MSDDIEPSPFSKYACSLGTVIGHESYPNTYRVAQADGRVIGVLANGECSEANVEADIANPPVVPTPVPSSVGPAQLRIAMRRLHGILPEDVLLVLNSLPEGTSKEDALDLWEYSTVLKRDHPLFAQVAPAFQLTEADVDDAFRLADTL